jgi:hypothetical protein
MVTVVMVSGGLQKMSPSLLHAPQPALLLRVEDRRSLERARLLTKDIACKGRRSDLSLKRGMGLLVEDLDLERCPVSSHERVRALNLFPVETRVDGNMAPEEDDMRL